MNENENENKCTRLGLGLGVHVSTVDLQIQSAFIEWNTVYKLNYAYIPFDDDLDIFEEPDGLLAVSGMCVSNALKKLYNCVRLRRKKQEQEKKGVKQKKW